MICALPCGCADVSLCNPFLADVLFGSNKGLLNVSTFIWEEVFHKRALRCFSKICFTVLPCRHALWGIIFGKAFPWDETFKDPFNARRASGFLTEILAPSAVDLLVVGLCCNCGTLFFPRSNTPLP